MRTVSEHLAAFGASVRYEALPPATVEMAKKSLLDWLGSVLAGTTQLPAVIARRFVSTLGGRPESAVFGAALRTDVVNAAFLNGLAAHIVELDDLHRPSTLHSGAPVIAAAMAAAERENCSGRRLIEAIVVGYDVAIRIAEAVNPSHYRFWHNTATCGTFGAAAAVAKVLGLDEPGFLHTLGSAGSQAAGLWEFLRDGTMTKHLHTGQAAHNGIVAAYLAREGFTGARTILDGEKGFFQAMAIDADSAKVTDGLGKQFKIMENSFKLYPCCGHTHSAIAAALELRQKLSIEPSRIQQVLVKTYKAALDITNNPHPSTPYQAKFSLPYTVAAGLVWGRAGLSEFEPDVLSDSRVRELMRRTRVEVERGHDDRYPQTWAATVDVVLQDGRSYSATVDQSPGEDGLNLSEETLERKLRELLAWAKTQDPASAAELDRCAETAAALRELERVERVTDIVTRPAAHLRA